jgi:hypothetical protein
LVGSSYAAKDAEISVTILAVTGQRLPDPGDTFTSRPGRSAARVTSSSGHGDWRLNWWWRTLDDDHVAVSSERRRSVRCWRGSQRRRRDHQ